MAKISPQKLVSVFNFARQAYGQYKFQILMLAGLSVVSGLLEGIGINALIPLFSFAIPGAAEATDSISRWIQQIFLSFNIEFSVKYLLAFIAALFILKAIVMVVIINMRVRITSDYEERIKGQLFERILAADWPHLIKQKLGHLETILLIDVPASSNLLAQIAGTITISASLLIYALIAVNISLPITLLAFMVGVFIFFGFRPLLVRIKRLADERTNLNRFVAHHINENVLGAKTIKTMVASAGVFQRGLDFFRRQRDVSVKAGLFKALPSILIQPISVLFIVLIFGLTYQAPIFNLAVLAAIVYLTERMFIYIQQLHRSFEVMIDLTPHLRNVVTYQHSAGNNREQDSGKQPFILNKELKFENVDFAYSADQQILQTVNLSIKKGETVGLIGPSGVGKTTLVDLILRLLWPTKGKILLDGNDASSVALESWRKKIGYVSQDLFLINDTIRNNIKFYSSKISDKDIEEAAKLADIGDFVKSLPDGLDTQIGDRGIRLSSGQRQRIVIARVLSRRPEFLIFDEATSSLDNQSEAQIQKVIRGLHGKVTVLLIAHRLSTLDDVDKLIVLEDGKITEAGTPRELLADKKSYYFKMHNIKTAS